MTLSGKTLPRRQVWHWLADHRAPTWLWQLFTRNWWSRCDHCGRPCHYKHAAIGGGAEGAARHAAGRRTTRIYCDSSCATAREGGF